MTIYHRGWFLYFHPPKLDPYASFAAFFVVLTPEEVSKREHLYYLYLFGHCLCSHLNLSCYESKREHIYCLFFNTRYSPTGFGSTIVDFSTNDLGLYNFRSINLKCQLSHPYQNE